MSVATAELSPDVLQRHRDFARRSYLSRMVGLALGFVMLSVVFVQNQAPPWMWIGPALHCFLGPQLGWWLARRAGNPRNAEQRNLLADHFLGGLWMAAMQFNLLPCVLTLSLLSMDSMAAGGARLLRWGLLWQAGGLGVGIAVFGWHWQPEPSLLIVLAGMPLMVCQPILISYIARRAIRRLEEQSLELRYQSQHDGLSGLLNRTHWEQQVRAEFARFRRHGEPAVLVLADLDYFKRINDLHGHAAGDEAIRRFAAALNGVLRETDVCGRYGGEEFGLLLPLTSGTAAREVLDRLRRDLHERPLLDAELITASFGVAELSIEVSSVEAWLRLADQMLYRAKHLGRDCVVVLGEPAAATAPGSLQKAAVVPSYSRLKALGDPLKLTRLLSGLDMGGVPLALFDPSDRLAVANPAFLKLFAVLPEAVSFGDIIRHCHAAQMGPRIATDDIDAWLCVADAKRRSQPQRNFLVDTCDGRWFHSCETSYSDGWLLLLLSEVAAPQPA